MQIVIDIPEREYEEIISSEDCGLHTLTRAIANGTPLPKGHGRLIDADELKKHKYHDSNRYENAVAVAQIDYAPTIIEADKENDTWQKKKNISSR